VVNYRVNGYVNNFTYSFINGSVEGVFIMGLVDQIVNLAKPVIDFCEDYFWIILIGMIFFIFGFVLIMVGIVKI